jgi:hypothetical protein
MKTWIADIIDTLGDPAGEVHVYAKDEAAAMDQLAWIGFSQDEWRNLRLHPWDDAALKEHPPV